METASAASSCFMSSCFHVFLLCRVDSSSHKRHSFSSRRGHGCPRRDMTCGGNFFTYPPSKAMSSVSGAQYEAEPPHAGTARSAIPDHAELDLLKKAQLGDRGAYGRLVVLYQDRLY